MTEHIKNQIEEYAQRFKTQVSSEGLQNIVTDASYGYSLSEQEITRLKGLIWQQFSTIQNLAMDIPSLRMTMDEFKKRNNL